MIYLNHTRKLSHINHESGFVIMVIPIFILLFSFFVSAMLKQSKPNEFYFESDVQQNMQDVRITLAAYSHKNYRIPCPANPAVGDGSEDCSLTSGVLPYRELGLPEIAAKDKWGHYYTYKVSPDFTKKINVANYDFKGADGLPVPKNDVANYVHKICQTPQWLDEGVSNYTKADGTDEAIGSTINLNKNIYKANFCCPANVSGSAGSGDATAISMRNYRDKANAEKQSSMTFKPDASDGSIDTSADDAVKFSLVKKEAYQALMNDAPDVAAAKTFHQGTEDYYLDPSRLDLGYNEFTQWVNGVESSTGEGLGHSAVHGGKTWDVGAEFEFVDPTIQTDNFTMSMTDVNNNDLNAPVQVYLDMVAPDGTVFEKVSYIIQMPASIPDGRVEMTLKVTDILGDANQPHLAQRDGFNMAWGLVDPNYIANGTPWELKYFPMNASRAQTYFNQQKAAFLTKLTAAGLSEADVASFKIKKVKFDTTFCSLGFEKISYEGGPSSLTSNNTDLVVLNEAGNPVLSSRDDPASYGPPDEKLAANTKVPQDFEAVAYALVSHGEDGEGSFKVNGTAAVYDNIPDAQESAFEKDNYSSTNVVRDMRKISSDTTDNKYDDIVMWDSQLTLYNSLRNGTCESAQAL